VLVGSLARTCIRRAVLSPAMGEPHLPAAITTLLGVLGGLTRMWRRDAEEQPNRPEALVVHPCPRRDV